MPAESRYSIEDQFRARDEARPMTTPRTPRAVAQLARETLRELGHGDLTYDFEMALAALAHLGWLHEPAASRRLDTK